jgi:hypothetical protein
MASTTANANNDVERAQSDLNTAQRNLPLIQEAYSQALYDWDGVKDDDEHPQYDRRRQAFVDAQNALDAGTTAMNNANQTLIAAKANRQPLIDGAAATLQRAQIAYDQLTKTPDPDAIASAQRAVTRAELAVKEASQSGDPELEKALSASKLALENIEKAIASGQLIAPFDGIDRPRQASRGLPPRHYRHQRLRQRDSGAERVDRGFVPYRDRHPRQHLYGTRTRHRNPGCHREVAHQSNLIRIDHQS